MLWLKRALALLAPKPPRQVPASLAGGGAPCQFFMIMLIARLKYQNPAKPGEARILQKALLLAILAGC